MAGGGADYVSLRGRERERIRDRAEVPGSRGAGVPGSRGAGEPRRETGLISSSCEKKIGAGPRRPAPWWASSSCVAEPSCTVARCPNTIYLCILLGVG